MLLFLAFAFSFVRFTVFSSHKWCAVVLFNFNYIRSIPSFSFSLPGPIHGLWRIDCDFFHFVATETKLNFRGCFVSSIQFVLDFVVLLSDELWFVLLWFFLPAASTHILWRIVIFYICKRCSVPTIPYLFLCSYFRFKFSISYSCSWHMCWFGFSLFFWVNEMFVLSLCRLYISLGSLTKTTNIETNRTE